jgi:hypothetical protein
MARLNSSSLVLASMVALGGIAGGLSGCASSGGASSTKPGEPVELKGARYKLLAAGGALDGRVVEFMQGGDTAVGCLAAPGAKLRSATGVDLGLRVFSIQKKGPNEWEGTYRAVGADGSISDKPVALNFDGDNMSWNLESATWERQSESNQLTEDQKKACKGK